MNTIILLLLFSHVGSNQYEVIDNVDLIEVNHYINNNGKYVFSQFIFWDYNSDKKRYEVVDWMLNKKVDYPRKCFATGEYQYSWFDEDSFAIRRVKSKKFRETISIGVDPERENRKVLPDENRRGLTQVPEVMGGK